MVVAQDGPPLHLYRAVASLAVKLCRFMGAFSSQLEDPGARIHISTDLGLADRAERPAKANFNVASLLSAEC